KALLILGGVDRLAEGVSIDPLAKLGFPVAKDHAIAYFHGQLGLFGLVAVRLAVHHQLMPVEVGHAEPLLERPFPSDGFKLPPDLQPGCSLPPAASESARHDASPMSEVG